MITSILSLPSTIHWWKVENWWKIYGIPPRLLPTNKPFSSGIKKGENINTTLTDWSQTFPWIPRGKVAKREPKHQRCFLGGRTRKKTTKSPRKDNEFNYIDSRNIAQKQTGIVWCFGIINALETSAPKPHDSCCTCTFKPNMAILGSTLNLQTLTKNQAFKDAPKKPKNIKWSYYHQFQNSKMGTSITSIKWAHP